MYSSIDTVSMILDSWINREGVISTNEEILAWIRNLNENTHMCVSEMNISDSNFWFYDDYNGEILNRKRSFFSIRGVRYFVDEEFVSEQPIIVQPEIGYLGIICKRINGVLHFLMQAKIEPGNVNCVQISPTIQATKSNFMRAHGGALPAYFEYFENSQKYKVIYDQIQSEQGSRFYKKRNRNMIMYLEEDIELLPNYRWMTLGQIKELMKIDNLINMDTRTVLSGLPVHMKSERDKIINYREQFEINGLFESIFEGDIDSEIVNVLQKINNYKMFHEVSVVHIPLNQLVDWKVNEYGVFCKENANFCVQYYKIEISGREVQSWTQPLFKAVGMAVLGIITRVINGKRMFLTKIKAEVGTFDKVELGPAIQWETAHSKETDGPIDRIFRTYLESKRNIMLDVILSEEGGRFYHEQNRNVIIEIDSRDFENISEEYIWVSYATLMHLIRMNNVVNIQLRDLISLIDLSY